MAQEWIAEALQRAVARIVQDDCGLHGSGWFANAFWHTTKNSVTSVPSKNVTGDMWNPQSDLGKDASKSLFVRGAPREPIRDASPLAPQAPALESYAASGGTIRTAAPVCLEAARAPRNRTAGNRLRSQTRICRDVISCTTHMTCGDPMG